MKKLKARLKQAHKSLTIWFNTSGAALLAVALAEPSLLAWLNSHGFTVYIIAGNLLLRFKTTSDLKDKGKDKK